MKNLLNNFLKFLFSLKETYICNIKNNIIEIFELLDILYFNMLYVLSILFTLYSSEEIYKKLYYILVLVFIINTLFINYIIFKYNINYISFDNFILTNGSFFLPLNNFISKYKKNKIIIEETNKNIIVDNNPPLEEEGNFSRDLINRTYEKEELFSNYNPITFIREQFSENISSESSDLEVLQHIISIFDSECSDFIIADYYNYLYNLYLQSDENDIDIITNKLIDLIRFKKVINRDRFPNLMKSWINKYEKFITSENADELKFRDNEFLYENIEDFECDISESSYGSLINNNLIKNSLILMLVKRNKYTKILLSILSLILLLVFYLNSQMLNSFLIDTNDSIYLFNSNGSYVNIIESSSIFSVIFIKPFKKIFNLNKNENNYPNIEINVTKEVIVCDDSFSNNDSRESQKLHNILPYINSKLNSKLDLNISPNKSFDNFDETFLNFGYEDEASIKSSYCERWFIGNPSQDSLLLYDSERSVLIMFTLLLSNKRIKLKTIKTILLSFSRIIIKLAFIIISTLVTPTLFGVADFFLAVAPLRLIGDSKIRNYGTFSDDIEADIEEDEGEDAWDRKSRLFKERQKKMQKMHKPLPMTPAEMWKASLANRSMTLSQYITRNEDPMSSLRLDKDLDKDLHGEIIQSNPNLKTGLFNSLHNYNRQVRLNLRAEYSELGPEKFHNDHRDESMWFTDNSHTPLESAKGYNQENEFSSYGVRDYYHKSSVWNSLKNFFKNFFKSNKNLDPEESGWID